VDTSILMILELEAVNFVNHLRRFLSKIRNLETLKKKIAFSEKTLMQLLDSHTQTLLKKELLQ